LNYPQYKEGFRPATLNLYVWNQQLHANATYAARRLSVGQQKLIAAKEKAKTYFAIFLARLLIGIQKIQTPILKT
jgi:hypothetical protein